MKRWLSRFILTLSWLGFTASVVLWIDSFSHARRIGWSHHAENDNSTTFTVVQLFNRRGQAEFVIQRRSHDGTALIDAIQRENYFTRKAGPFWVKFPAEWDSVIPSRANPSVLGMIGFYRDTSRTPWARPVPVIVTRTTLGFPDWLLVVVTGVVLLVWVFRALRRRHRSRRGLCIVCAYDLRASTERCPECGTSVPRRRGNQRSMPASIATGGMSGR